MSFSKKEKYVKNGRLEDVLSLLQVLALDKSSHRSEGGLKKELYSVPVSANGWLALAKDHPEFFRVGVITVDLGRADRHQVSGGQPVRHVRR